MVSILYVDSDPEFCSIASQVIRLNLGVEVQIACSGRLAMECMRRGQRFDVIVSEYAMCEGSGAELFEFIGSNGIICCFFLFTDQRLSAENLETFKGWNFHGLIRKNSLTSLCGAIVFSVETASLPVKLSEDD